MKLGRGKAPEVRKGWRLAVFQDKKSEIGRILHLKSEIRNLRLDDAFARALYPRTSSRCVDSRPPFSRGIASLNPWLSSCSPPGCGFGTPEACWEFSPE